MTSLCVSECIHKHVPHYACAENNFCELALSLHYENFKGHELCRSEPSHQPRFALFLRQEVKIN